MLLIELCKSLHVFVERSDGFLKSLLEILVSPPEPAVLVREFLLFRVKRARFLLRSLGSLDKLVLSLEEPLQ